jgi:hypothetical protein
VSKGRRGHLSELRAAPAIIKERRRLANRPEELGVSEEIEGPGLPMLVRFRARLKGRGCRRPPAIPPDELRKIVGRNLPGFGHRQRHHHEGARAQFPAEEALPGRRQSLREMTA